MQIRAGIAHVHARPQMSAHYLPIEQLSLGQGVSSVMQYVVAQARTMLAPCQNRQH